MKLLSAIAGALMLSSPALAADPVITPLPPLPTTVVSPSFAWGGLYVGLFGGLVVPSADRLPFAGAQAGINIQGDNGLVGVEGQIGRAFTESMWAAGVNARAGLLLGPNALVYVEAGVAVPVPFDFTARTYNAGGGLEFAVGDNTTLFIEGKAIFDNGFGYQGAMVGAGINFHLNR